MFFSSHLQQIYNTKLYTQAITNNFSQNVNKKQTETLNISKLYTRKNYGRGEEINLFCSDHHFGLYA